jgi:hypothetical protein
MDLERLGDPRLAGQFIGWYAEYSGLLEREAGRAPMAYS